MLSLIEVIKFNKPIKRKVWSSFYYNTNFYNLKKEDILAKDWEIEGQVWKELEGFNLKYSLDNFGNLYSHRLKKCFTPKISKLGYYEVTLRYDNGKVKSHLIHHLVGKYFLNHVYCKQKDLIINHIDGNKLNNCIENLEIVTRSRNSKHAYELGLNKPRYGERCNMTRLTTHQVNEIKTLLKDTSLSQKEIGNLYSVKQSCISRIKMGHSWKNLK